jgi:lipopolysaccharide transport system ATP-binding protein
MSGDAIITAEKLGKKYRVAHQEKHAGYNTLREVVSQKAKAFLSNPRQFVRGSESFEEFWALKDVCLEVKQGEVVGVIGRNGAGKSTLLKILSRITEPTEGCVRIRGRVASLLEVGTGFHQELTGRENIFLNGAILGMTRAEIRKKFDEIVAFAEVETFLDTPVKWYSSGMYVRLAFAVAAHLEPEILIVDEVLAVGDAQFQKKCLGKMRSVSTQEGRTVLFVSHNMTAISTLCQKAAWLDRGRLVSRGDVRQTVSAYLQAGAQAQCERFWPDADRAPGNGQARLRRVRVSSCDSNPSEPFTVATPLELAFEYWNNVEGAQLNLSAFIHNIEGECIFNTFSESQTMPKGLARSSFVIPANLLNDGTYSVRVMVVRNEAFILVDADQIVTFEVRDIPRTTAWHGKWSGIVRPHLIWKTEALGELVSQDQSYATISRD